MSEDNNETENQNEIADGAATDANAAEQSKAELEKAKKDYLYLAADFDNYRKNAIKERSDLVKFGNERLIRELLGVVDNFERALESGADAEKFREGIQMIDQELKSLLQRFGVNEVAAQGQPFDPAAHEALSSEPTSEMEPGHVFRVFKKAYKLHDRLIRPAQVVVASKPPASAEDPS
jgi:molecular chaperone GrpE